MTFEERRKQLMEGTTPQVKAGAVLDTPVNEFKNKRQALISRETYIPEYVGEAIKKKLPSGGEFLSVPGQPNVLAKQGRDYGTLETLPGKERDHIIPVSLGGTSGDPNMQYLKSDKTFLQTLFNKPASLKNRQEGKVVVELDAINKYKKGEISLAEARLQVLNWNNQPDTFWKNLPSSIAETIAPVIKEVSNIPTYDPLLQDADIYKKIAKEIPGAVKQVGTDLLKWMYGLPIEFGLDVVKGVSGLLGGKVIDSVNIGGTEFKARSTLSGEEHADAIEFAKAQGVDSNIGQNAVALSQTMINAIFRTTTFGGITLKTGLNLGKKVGFKKIGAFEVKGKIDPLINGKPVKNASVLLKDKQGNVGIAESIKTKSGVRIDIYAPRNLKGELGEEFMAKRKQLMEGKAPEKPVTPEPIEPMKKPEPYKAPVKTEAIEIIRARVEAQQKKGISPSITDRELLKKDQTMKDLASVSESEAPSKISTVAPESRVQPLPETQRSTIIPEAASLDSDTLYKIPSNLTKPVKLEFSPDIIDKLPSNLTIQYKNAIVKSKDLDTKLNNIKQTIPNSDYFIRIKKTERALEKFKNGKIPLDVLGSMFTVKEESGIPSALIKIKENFAILSIDNFFKSTNKWGYKGINIKVRDNNFTYEIQIHTNQTRKAALEAHKIYEKWRNKKIETLTESDKIEYLKDMKKSREIFSGKPEIKKPGVSLEMGKLAMAGDKKALALSKEEFVESGIAYYKTTPEYINAPDGDKLWYENTTRNNLLEFYNQSKKALEKPAEKKPLVEPKMKESEFKSDGEWFRFGKTLQKGVELVTSPTQLEISALAKKYNTTQDIVRKALNRAAGFIKKVEVEQKPKTSTIQEIKFIPKDLEPLAQEAKKYKGAEEFVKAPNVDDVSSVAVLKDGKLGKGNKTVLIEKVKTKENADILRNQYLDELTRLEKEIKQIGGREKASANLLLRRTNAESNVKAMDAIKPELPTKSQLTEIWEKAVKKAPEAKIVVDSKTLAKDLIESRTKAELDAKLQKIFGTHEELDALENIDTYKKPNKKLAIADDYMADVEYSANQRDYEETERLLGEVLERQKQEVPIVGEIDSKTGMIKFDKGSPIVKDVNERISPVEKPAEIPTKNIDTGQLTLSIKGKNAAKAIQQEISDVEKALKAPNTEEGLEFVKKVIDNKIEDFRLKVYPSITEGAGRRPITIGGQETTIFSKGKAIKNLGAQKRAARQRSEEDLLRYDEEFVKLKTKQFEILDNIKPKIPEEPMFKKLSNIHVRKAYRIESKNNALSIEKLLSTLPDYLERNLFASFKKMKDYGEYTPLRRFGIIRIAKFIADDIEFLNTGYHEVGHHAWSYLSLNEKYIIKSEFEKLINNKSSELERIFSKSDREDYIEDFQEKARSINLKTSEIRNFIGEQMTNEFFARVMADVVPEYDFVKRTFSKKATSGWSDIIRKIAQKFIEFIKRFLKIHPRTKGVASEKVNNIIKNIFTNEQNRIFRPTLGRMTFRRAGEFLPGEKEVIRLMQEGKNIPEDLKPYMDSLKKKGIIQETKPTTKKPLAIKPDTVAIRKTISQIRKLKNLDNSVAIRLKKVFRIDSLNTATKPQLDAVLSEIKGLQKGDKYLTGDYIGGHKKFLEETFKKDIRLVTKREVSKISEIPPVPVGPKELRPKDIIAQIKKERTKKKLDSSVAKRLKDVYGIDEWKNATINQLSQVLKEVKNLAPGSRFLTELQIKGLKEFTEKGFPDTDPMLITQQDLQIKFKEIEEVMSGGLVGKIANELFPTVDIKEGHPIVTKLVNRADVEMRRRDTKIKRSLLEFDKLNQLAIKSRQKKGLARVTERGIVKKIRSGEIIFNAMAGFDVELTPNEKALVDFLKKDFARLAEDLALEKRRKYYITHIKKDLSEKLQNVWDRRKELLQQKILRVGLKNAIEETINPQSQDIPIDILMAMDEIIGSKKFFQFALERKGGMDPSMNIQRIYEYYLRLAETKITLDMILPEAQAAQQLLLQPHTAIWMKKYLQNMKGRGLDWKFRNGKMGWMAKGADSIINLQYVFGLGLGWESALKNILGGESNSIIWQPIGQYLIGKARLMSNPKKAYEISERYGLLDGSYVELTKHDWLHRGKTITDHILYGFQEGAEFEIRSSQFIGQMTKEEFDSGRVSANKFSEIMKTMEITQGVYTKTSSPLFVQTFLGRSFMQFNRWRLTNLLLVRRIAKGTKEEFKSGNFTGPNFRRLTKALIMYSIGVYLSYELAKRGLKRAARIAKASAELLNTIAETISMEPIIRMYRDNPLARVLVSAGFDLATFLSKVKITKPPATLEFKGGLGELFMRPVETLREIGILKEEYKSNAYNNMKERILNKIKTKHYNSIVEIKGDKDLMDSIDEFNKKQEKLLTEKLMKEKPDMTKNEFQKQLKSVTIQDVDIERWIKPAEIDGSGAQF